MRSKAFILVLTMLVAPATAWGQFGRNRPIEFQPFQAPSKRFAMQYPKKDWNVVVGAGSVLVLFAHVKAEASVAVDHTVMKQALSRDEITQLFADLEVDDLKQREPAAQGFKTALRTESDGRRIIVIEFTRPGIKGVEQVRQYLLPNGADLYRLICSAAPVHFGKYDAVFERMAATFTAPPSAGENPSSR